MEDLTLDSMGADNTFGETNFNPNNMEQNEKAFSRDFGWAIKMLKEGYMLRRSGWNGKGMFVVKQIPATIGTDIIPKMQSLPPQAAKDEMLRRDQSISYTNQMLIVNAEGRADSWVPSSSDCFAEDWETV